MPEPEEVATSAILYEIHEDRISRIEDVLREQAAEQAGTNVRLGTLETRVEEGFVDMKKDMREGFAKMDSAIATLTGFSSGTKVQVDALQVLSDHRGERRKLVFKNVLSVAAGIILLLVGALISAKFGH